MNVFFIIATVVYILIFYSQLPPFVPVFNQLPWGEQRLGNTITIFIPVLVALSILVLNIFTASFSYKKAPLVSRMLAAISLLSAVLMFLFIIKTVSLIT